MDRIGQRVRLLHDVDRQRQEVPTISFDAVAEPGLPVLRQNDFLAVSQASQSITFGPADIFFESVCEDRPVSKDTFSFS